jgi:hypothetical protein
MFSFHSKVIKSHHSDGVKRCNKMMTLDDTITKIKRVNQYDSI